MYVGKAPGCHHWPQDKIRNVIVAAARQGKRVVRLKCGDPGVFARGQEEADALAATDIPFEVVPGVTAASGASAALGGFLTQRGSCDTLVLTTGQSAQPNQTPNWLATLRPGTRIAVYMGISSASDIAQAILDAGHGDHVQIDIVANAQAGSDRKQGDGLCPQWFSVRADVRLSRCLDVKQQRPVTLKQRIDCQTAAKARNPPDCLNAQIRALFWPRRWDRSLGTRCSRPANSTL